jgi:ferredoxin
VQGEAKPGKCTVSSEEGRESIAGYLGVDVGAEEKLVARLACAGGTNVARNRAHYDGLPSCGAAARVAGGGKSCFWGCLGLADCRDACDFDAIAMNAHSLPVVDEDKCTACGDCVTACPKDLFSLESIGRRLWVACKSQDAGDEMLEDCEVGCTACARCAMDAPGLIAMTDNLPVIDYEKNHRTKEPIQRCPTGAIVWLDPQGPEKGPAARKIIRKGTLHDAPS